MALFGDFGKIALGAAQGYLGGGGSLSAAFAGGVGALGGLSSGGVVTLAAAPAPPAKVPARPVIPSTGFAGTPGVVGALLKTVAQRMGLASLTLSGLMSTIRRFGAPWAIGAGYIAANELLFLMQAHQKRASRKSSRAMSITGSQMRKTRQTIRKLQRMHCLLREVAGSAGGGRMYGRTRRRAWCPPKKTRRKVCA